ncbi:LppD family lipoprotein [Mycoplasmopsis californica HAZ160_1]|uniref:LppD family lipoprotein n=1 Tax=Mycoplasmopsis californica HAZ160_1 TaxID=1397850 RepID=A0AAT9F925_9BACT|nr:DUF31 family protein [Mycoplasmopsis californica]BAP01341.1 LppD family lipoprotein [Mycoplasmopsis californica HAZ160_1]BBG41215.1 LppD family lipoprotein [Mycoplasmopsis californica]BBG41808.1 LppD family lipoprotein [Mycoplasmopsis californica]BBG42402.1 LppD family lipoprotein [Mycoplasmopsis californica]BBG42976.1 LppD family lipoprotein [Mycoplasmopsis californica]
MKKINKVLIGTVSPLLSGFLLASCVKNVKEPEIKLLNHEIEKRDNSINLLLELNSTINNISLKLESGEELELNSISDRKKEINIPSNKLLKKSNYRFEIINKDNKKIIASFTYNTDFTIEKEKENKPLKKDDEGLSDLVPNDIGLEDDKKTNSSPVPPTPMEPKPTNPLNKPEKLILPPKLPDAFQFPKRNLNNGHTYPEFVNNFQKIKEEEAYKEIYDRSFSIKFGVQQNTSYLTTDSGTGWLLDYAKLNDNKYKLFIATNLHVIGELSNTLDTNIAKELNYDDKRSGFKADGVALGKALNLTDFSAKNNNFNYGDPKYAVKYLSNSEKIASEDKNNTTKTEGISSPKLIFAGYDFINQDEIQKFQEPIKQIIKERISYLEKENSITDENDESVEVNVLKKSLKNNDFIPFYTDFAVLEVEVDFSKLGEPNSKMFKDAIQALDKYLKRNKELNLPNQDKKISEYMQTTDYVSAGRLNDGNSLTNSQQLYIAGYPKNSGALHPVWSRNNPIERNSNEKWDNRAPINKDAFALSTNNFEEKVSVNYQPWTKAFGRTLIEHYGFNMRINFSSLYYGASGSLVYNDFGQMVGAYSQVAGNVNFGDLSKTAGFTPLLLSKDYQAGENTIFAYNLIDGSNKSLFPKQTKSYRENLKKIYPNGFDGSIKTTALFEKGI